VRSTTPTFECLDDFGSRKLRAQYEEYKQLQRISSATTNRPDSRIHVCLRSTKTGHTPVHPGSGSITGLSLVDAVIQ